jgi:hypothetical protein
MDSLPSILPKLGAGQLSPARNRSPKIFYSVELQNKYEANAQ